MSATLKLLDICPLNNTNGNNSEVIILDGFKCPECNGKGFFNYSGYMEKFKRNLDDPDFIVCPRCMGAAELQANITIQWSAADKPSKCPQNEQ